MSRRSGDHRPKSSTSCRRKPHAYGGPADFAAVKVQKFAPPTLHDPAVHVVVDTVDVQVAVSPLSEQLTLS